MVEDGVPTLGIVYAPAKGRLFYTTATGAAVEEAGDFTKDVPGPTTPIRVSTANNAALRIVASKSHRSPELEAYIDRYQVADSVAAGSSLKILSGCRGRGRLLSAPWTDDGVGHGRRRRNSARGRRLCCRPDDAEAVGLRQGRLPKSAFSRLCAHRRSTAGVGHEGGRMIPVSRHRCRPSTARLASAVPDGACVTGLLHF